MQLLPLSEPADEIVRREVRYASGFGCVRCGCTVYRYHRIGGGSLSRLASAEDVVLLCPPCIHALAGKEGAEAALRTMRANPVARQKLFDRRKLPYLAHLVTPDVVITDGVTIRDTMVPIAFGGIPVLKLAPPEASGGAIDLSIALGAGDGVPVRIVRSNEWMVEDDSWRFERPGNRYVMTSRDGMAKLILAIDASDRLVIEKLRTRAGARMLEVDRGSARIDGVVVRMQDMRAQIIGLTL